MVDASNNVVSFMADLQARGPEHAALLARLEGRAAQVEHRPGDGGMSLRTLGSAVAMLGAGRHGDGQGGPLLHSPQAATAYAASSVVDQYAIIQALSFLKQIVDDIKGGKMLWDEYVTRLEDLYALISAHAYVQLFPTQAALLRRFIRWVNVQKAKKGAGASPYTCMTFGARYLGRWDPVSAGADDLDAEFNAFVSTSVKEQKDLRNHTMCQQLLDGHQGGRALMHGQRSGGGRALCPKCHGGHALASCPEGVALHPDGSENVGWEYTQGHPRRGGVLARGAHARPRPAGRGRVGPRAELPPARVPMLME